MDKAHDVRQAAVNGTVLTMLVDGRKYEIDLTEHSERLAKATPRQREHFCLSPSGYGFHWPDLDEDLSIDGLIGVRHQGSLTEMHR